MGWLGDYAEAESIPYGRDCSMWQPIETAPTDGTNVLLFIPRYAMGRTPYVMLQGWNIAADRRGWRSHYKGGEVEPTHWMPLPKPPQATGAVDPVGELAKLTTDHARS